MSAVKYWKWWDRFGLLSLVAVMVLGLSLCQENFWSKTTALNLLSAEAPVAIAAAGMTLAITAGVFDLSIGSLLALISVSIGLLIQPLGLFGAMVAGLALGAVAGAINGLIVTQLRIQAFIATLGTLLLWRGMALWVGDGKDLSLVKVPGIAVLPQSWCLAALVIIVYAISAVLYYRLPFGTHVRAIGSSASSAFSSGVPVNTVLVCTFMFLGFTTGLASIIQTSQYALAGCNLGVAFELDVITVVLLGGTALQGGLGRLGGTILATVLLGVLRIGLDLAAVQDEYQRLAIGMLLILALLINGLRRGQRAAS
jgi:ribose transport system permease protein